jgi:hypothetical protein
MSDRGMKKWAPYASLIEQKGTVVSMKENRRKMAKPLLSQDQANEINDALLNIKNTLAKITYYRSGHALHLQGVVTAIQFDQKYLIINEQTIAFKEIIKINLNLPIK